MSDTDIVDAEIVTTTLATTDPHGFALYKSTTPAEQLSEAREIATVLVEVVKERGLYKNLGGTKPHVFCDGWVFLGGMVGVFPVTEWTRELKDADGNALGWEARVLAQTPDGFTISASESECRFDEANWKGKPSYALRGMAQTRATGRALRQPLSPLMVLAGFAATPAEEMDGINTATPVPASVDDPHCPACRVELGVMSPLFHNDKKPFWKCKAKDCPELAKPNAAGKTYAWSGWHETFEASANEWLDKNGHPKMGETERKIVRDVGGESPHNAMHGVNEISAITGVTKDEAKPMFKDGLAHLLITGGIDHERFGYDTDGIAAVTDDQLREIALRLTVEETDLVVAHTVEQSDSP